MWKSLSEPSTIRNKFSTGNLDTLSKPGIRDALLKFYHQYYSADIMDLVLYSDEDLDTLQKYTV